jgi:hypothetical protein
MNGLHYIKLTEAAKSVGLPPRVLRDLHTAGRGPAAFCPSPKRILYLQADLDAWLAAHRVQPKPKGAR